MYESIVGLFFFLLLNLGVSKVFFQGQVLLTVTNSNQPFFPSCNSSNELQGCFFFFSSCLSSCLSVVQHIHSVIVQLIPVPLIFSILICPSWSLKIFASSFQLPLAYPLVFLDGNTVYLSCIKTVGCGGLVVEEVDLASEVESWQIYLWHFLHRSFVLSACLFHLFQETKNT